MVALQETEAGQPRSLVAIPSLFPPHASALARPINCCHRIAVRVEGGECPDHGVRAKRSPQALHPPNPNRQRRGSTVGLDPAMPDGPRGWGR